MTNKLFFLFCMTFAASSGAAQPAESFKEVAGWHKNYTRNAPAKRGSGFRQGAIPPSNEQLTINKMNKIENGGLSRPPYKTHE